ATEAEDDLVCPNADVGKDFPHGAEDVFAFLRFAPHALRRIHPNVRCPGQDFAEIGNEDADPSVLVLEEDHVSVERLAELRIVDGYLRPFIPVIDPCLRYPAFPLSLPCLVVPGSGRVDVCTVARLLLLSAYAVCPDMAIAC